MPLTTLVFQIAQRRKKHKIKSIVFTERKVGRTTLKQIFLVNKIKFLGELFK